MTKIRLAILALFIISWQFIAAQVYPVQVTTQLSAPYSLYLPDYVSPGSERLVVTAFLGDISRPELNVRFKLRVEGQGIILETKPDYIPAPLSLQGGVPLRMISSDLAPYFEPRNLNFLQGLTQREFEQQGGKLPEGLYSFCFEVLEYNRGVKISNSGCANAWMILNDPPIINIPRQDEKLKPLNPQNFVIQWTPRHTGSPNSAFNTEYEVSMVEVWPATRNPNDAILTSPPIFETTTESTTVIYGPAETPLEPGRRYAFRIRAKSKVGIDELDLFKNHGYSEVYTFTYGDACALPEEISAEAFTSRFNLTWDGKFNHTAFNVRYRKAGTTDWYVNKSTFNEVAITSLRPSTVYEYQVSGACGWYESDYTTVATVKTKDEPERTYSCGLPMETFNLDPSKLTGSLKVGDVIDAGDFDVELTKVTGGAGVFSGEAIVVMPMMNKIKVKAEFSNITVAGVPTATDYRMVKGFMNVTGGGIEVIPAGIVNAMDKLVETLDKIDSALNIIEDYIPKKGPDPVSFAADTLVNVDGNILAVVRDPNSGKVIVTTTGGKVTTLAPGKNYALTDKDGKGYVVDSNGAVTKTTADVATKASQRKYNFAVQFSNVTTLTSPGGFDPYTGNNILSSTYESLNKTYFVPWKASAQTGTASVTAVLTDRSLDASKVRFEMIDVQGTSTLTGDRWTFNITAATTGKIVAYYPASGAGDKEQILGKVNIQGFDPKPYKLVIVKDADGKYPFTNNDVKVLTDSLNRIYGQALVSWQVSYEERDFNIDKSFDAGNSGLLSNYTADMRKVINAYGSLQNETYYLFVIDKPTNSGDVVGFMPRSQQAGFIYTTGSTTPASFIHTAAHELGHGVFNLKHIFDEFTGLGEKSTKNLMDYTDNTSHHFMRFQWERIHDPVTVIGLFEEDEDAQYKSWEFLEGDLVANIPGYETVSKSFLSLAGEIITLPSNARDFTFYNGYLARFTIDNERYVSIKSGDKFSGYFFDAIQINENAFDTKNAKPYVGELKDLSKKPVVFFALQGSGCGVLDVMKADYLGTTTATNNGGIDRSIGFYKDNNIKEINALLKNYGIVQSVNNKINCLSGRSKELYKFIIDHYEFNKNPISGAEADELIAQLSVFSLVHIKDLDGAIPIGYAQQGNIRIREMLKYGVVEFLAKLKILTADLLEKNPNDAKLLVVEFEDYNRFKDAYLLYKLIEKVDADCGIAEHLRDEINKQFLDKGTVEFNLAFFGAVIRSGYEIYTGNEIFELITCILKNIKAPESLYNPNRMDHTLTEIYESLFEYLLGSDSHSMAASIPIEIANYELACGCGVWNSLVDLVLGLSELGSGVTQNPYDLFKKLKEFYETIKQDGAIGEMGDGVWNIIKDHHGYVEGYGVDSYQATYGACYDVIFVASFFVGAGELKLLSEAGKLGDIGEMARIIVRAAKAYPAKTILSFKQLGQAVATISNVVARKIAFQIFEAIPTKVLAKLPPNLKGVIIATELNDVVRFTELGTVEFLTPIENTTDRTKNILYQSAESITDVNGNNGKLVLVDEEGKIVGYLEGVSEVNDIQSILSRGAKIDELTVAPAGYEIYEVKNSKYIRRLDKTDPNTPRVTVDGEGKIVKYSGATRSNNSYEFSRNLEKIYGPLPEGHQRHHIVPVNVVDKSLIHQEAIKRGLYSVDRGSNGKYLAEIAEYFDDASREFPTHLGSHSKYDIQITNINNEYLNALIVKYGSMDKVPDDMLTKALDAIEQRSLKILEDWQPPSLN